MSQPTPPFRSKNPPCRTQPTQLTQLSLYICVYARSFLITDRIIFKNINNRKKLCRVARLCCRQGSRSPLSSSRCRQTPGFLPSLYRGKKHPGNLPPPCPIFVYHFIARSPPHSRPEYPPILSRSSFFGKSHPNLHIFSPHFTTKKKTAFIAISSGHPSFLPAV